ncbi:Thrombospondin-2 [Acipenser ruthenus]|uniref:Thrombospondin-2 n=1 Tax=Acipenser ruthenus TaxID=7906 RepID=A0A444UTY4_ACIRT|nr:Thrombospondin-2 [Acipenser ruthenus]
MSVIQLNPYYTDVSETGFVKWVKEPDNLTLIQTTSTVLANRTNIDECMRDLHQCSPRAACINTLGSYVCTCQFGFFQEGNECRATSIWTPWSPWSLCSVTCGSQNQMRIRICTNPESGMRCEGPTSDLKPCSSLRACPVDGLWSEWSPWSTCTVSCSGIKRRIRVCNNPAPSSGGQSCLGSPEEIAPCNNDNCPVNGMWSPWAPWTLCPLTCGLGVVSRSRHCNNPPPVSGGTPCPGHGYEEGSCGFPVKVYCILLLVFVPKINACDEAEYNINGQCCPMCQAGMRVYRHCTPDSSTSCIPCRDSTYTEKPNGLDRCYGCKLCDSGSSIADTECEDCPNKTYSDGSLETCKPHTE